MIAKPIKYKQGISHNDGKLFYWMFFKDSEGKSYRSFLRPGYGNFNRWQVAFDAVKNAKEVWLDGLVLKGKGIVDADSRFMVK